MGGLLLITMHGVILLFVDSVQGLNLTLVWFVIAAATVGLFAIVLALSRKYTVPSPQAEGKSC